MKSEVSHIVLTRFNLAIRFGYDRKDTEIPIASEAPWLDKEYLGKRFEIFEKYTFPSLQNQTDKDFKWIVMFHKDTPKVYKDKIREFTNRMPQMEAWFFDDEGCKTYKQDIKEYIKRTCPGGVITTRIDNDDIMHRTFIEKCKKAFEKVKGTSVLTYVNGYQYDSRNDIIINYDFVNNHFLSLYVPAEEEVDHIFMYNHVRIDDSIEEKARHKIVERTSIPLWVEVITETNCVNDLIWRWNSFLVPYEIKTEYPMLNVKWKSKMQWRINVAWGTCKIPFYRVAKLISIIMNR